MDGESYHTLNPFALDLLPYSEVYALVKNLNIGDSTPRRGRVSKEVLIERIIEFHRGRNDEGHTLIDSENASESQENLPMNVTGNNFAVLQVIPDTGDRRKSKFPRSRSSDDFNDYIRPSTVVKADANYLRALQEVDMSICTDTPSKSILKKCCDSPTSVQKEMFVSSVNVPRSAQKLLNGKQNAGGNANDYVLNMSMSSSKAKPPTPGKLDKITFSPFNAVKVIPHRTHMFDPCKQLTFGFAGQDETIPEDDETDNSHMEDGEEYDEGGEEEDQDENYDYYPEDEIYSDDETNNLVLYNTACNSGQDAVEQEMQEPDMCSGHIRVHRHGGDASPTLNSHEFFEL